MTSITAQQTKLDLELVPKENRLDIGKCNGIIPRRLKPKEETFQVVLDALALTLCYPAFVITADVPEVYMHQFWISVYKHHDFYRFKIDKKKRFKLTLEVFRYIFQICPRIEGQDFDALPSKEDTVSFLRELGHTGVINSLKLSIRCINRMYYQKNVDYVELLWEYFIYQIDNRGYKKQEKMYYPRFTKVIIHHFLIQDKTLSWRNKFRMHTSKDDYLINTLRFVSRREASQKYGAVLPECLTSPQMKESKAYKTYHGYATGTIPPKVAKKFKKASPSKKDSVPVPVDEEPVQKGKRVKRSAKKSSTTPTTSITKEVRKKSLRDFHKSHPSGFGSVAKKPPSVEKITPPVISEGTGSERENDSEEHESDSKQDTDGSESNSESDQQDDDDDEFKDDDEVDYNDADKSEGDEDRGMDNDDAHDNKADVGITDAQQETENLEITQEQVVEDAYVRVTKKTEVPVTSSSRSSDLASKFLNFSDIPPVDAEIVSPLDVHVHHEVPRIHTSTLLAVPSTPSPLPTTETTNIPPSILDFASVFRFNDRVIALEKDVAELKNNPLHTQVTVLVDDHLDTRMGATREEFMNFLSASLTDRITKQVRNQLPQILPEEVSNFFPPVIEKMIQESLNQVNLAKASSQPQSTYEAATILTEFELKKILIDKMNSSKSYLTALEHRECYDGLIKSYNLDNDFFSSYDVYSLKRGRDDKDKDEGPSAGSDRGLKKNPVGPAFRLLKGTCLNYAKLEYDFEECYKALLEKLDWENPEGGDYPFHLSKPLPLITRINCQSVPVEYFINNDLKYLQGGVSTMTYTTSTTKTKAAQYDLPGIEDMVPNIWSPVKVAYDKYALWGISHWRDQRKTFYAYARGIQPRGDVYSTKCILAVTHVLVMRKHGYGYLEEIVSWLTKLSGDDFAIALRMFTRSLVIQKRVEDLQLRVESFQKQINVANPDTTRPDLRKRHPYTPYKNPQGFIYVDDY
nr:hypothetical protein [Tanacetum cinerariifolium]